MAVTETTVPMDDKDLWDSATGAEPAAEAETPPAEVTPPEVAPAERPRDEHGRFKAKEADAAPKQQPAEQEQPTEQPQETRDEANVPSWRLREVREAREAAERRAEEQARNNYALQAELQAMRQQLANLQRKPQEPVDFFANPESAVAQYLSPIEQRLAQIESSARLSSSKAMAIASYGAPAVRDMETAVEKAMASGHPDMAALSMQMRNSDDPVGVAMRWHQSNRLWETTGGDPEAYRQKILDEALKDKAFQAKVIEAARGQAQGQPGNRPVINVPPSLNRATGTGGNTASDDDGSDGASWNYATQGLRR